MHIAELCVTWQLADLSSPIARLRNATWTLSNLVRGQPPPNLEEMRGAIPTLARLITTDDEEVGLRCMVLFQRRCLAGVD